MSELIRREDAINAVEMFFKDAYIEDSDVHCTDMEYEINHIPAASPWHRVEEPPKEEGKYLVYDGRGNYHVAWWGPRLGWCYDPKFFCYWMPIEPPKEGGMNIPIPSEPRTITSDKLFVLAIGENGEVCKVNTDGYPVMRGTLNCETGTLILEPKEDA